MFQPGLRLIPEIDGQLSRLAETEVPNAFYAAGNGANGAPKGLEVGAHVTPGTPPLKYKAKSDAGSLERYFTDMEA